MAYLGDFRLGETFDTKFCTVTTTGAPTQLAGSPVISAYPGNSTTQITAGITLSVDFDSRTGLNNVRVVATSGNGYAFGTNVALVITTGTVNSVSVVGEVVGSFSIGTRGVTPIAASPKGTVDNTGFTPTTTAFEASGITEATSSHYNNRVVLWTSGAMLGQANQITAYNYNVVEGRGHFTVSTMTESPSNGATFVII